MEFGVFHEFPSLEGRPDAEAFEGAERWGLDAMWLAEPQFDPLRSILSSPMVVASAIAACAKRMKIGIAMRVPRLGNPPPIRVAATSPGTFLTMTCCGQVRYEHEMEAARLLCQAVRPRFQ